MYVMFVCMYIYIYARACASVFVFFLSIVIAAN